MPHRRSARLVAVIGAFLLGGVVLAAPASAHDELVSSSPADGATLTKLPRRVVLSFEEPPEPAPLRMFVTGPDGKRVNTSRPVMSGSQLIEGVADHSPSGTYVVSFAIMSDDGHPVSGRIRFTVRPAGSKTSSAHETTASGASSGPGGAWVAAAAGALVLGSGAAAVLAFRRRRRSLVGSPATDAG